MLSLPKPGKLISVGIIKAELLVVEFIIADRTST